MEIVMLAAYMHTAHDSRIVYREGAALVDAGFKAKLIIPHTTDDEVAGVKIRAAKMPVTKWDKLVGSSWQIFRMALSESRKAVYHIHDHKLLFIAYLLRLTGRKVLYDAHEDLPLHISYQHWIPGWFKPVYGLFFRVLEWCSPFVFNRVICSEPLIARHFPKGKVEPIQTFPKKSDFDFVVDKQKKPSIFYSGTLTVPRGIDFLVETLDTLWSEMEFEFHFAGKFSPPELVQRLEGKPYFVNHGLLPLPQAYRVQASCAIGIYLPTNIPRYTINRPIKLYEFLATGTPLVTFDFGFTGELISKTKSGVAVPYGDTTAAAKACAELLNDEKLRAELGANGKRVVFEEFNWEHEAEKLVGIYYGILGKSPA
jgi:glycosyltransferase involved in cell wall biosynthesis